MLRVIMFFAVVLFALFSVKYYNYNLYGIVLDVVQYKHLLLG